MTIKLGDLVQDKVSNFKGIVCAQCDYLYGATQFGIKPKDLDKDGNRKDMVWYEEPALEVLEG